MIIELKEHCYLPEDISECWIVVNSVLIADLCRDLKSIGKKLSIPNQICTFILQNAGFVALEDVQDREWLSSIALALTKKQLPLTDLPYSKSYSDMVEELIENTIGNLMKISAKEIMAHNALDSFTKAQSRRAGANSRKKYMKQYKDNIKKYGIKKREELVKDILNSKVDACIICLENTTKGMKQLICCGHMIHNYCFDKWHQQKDTCPNCRRHTILDKKLNDIKMVYTSVDTYTKHCEEYKAFHVPVAHPMQEKMDINTFVEMQIKEGHQEDLIKALDELGIKRKRNAKKKDASIDSVIAHTNEMSLESK